MTHCYYESGLVLNVFFAESEKLAHLSRRKGTMTRNDVALADALKALADHLN